MMMIGRRGSGESFQSSVKSDKRFGEKISITRFDKFDKIKARMEELEMKRRDKHRDFVKQEGVNFLGAMKFYNQTLDPHIANNINPSMTSITQTQVQPNQTKIYQLPN